MDYVTGYTTTSTLSTDTTCRPTERISITVITTSFHTKIDDFWDVFEEGQRIALGHSFQFTTVNVKDTIVLP